MSSELENTLTDSDATNDAATEAVVDVQAADFPSMLSRPSNGPGRPLSRFYDVKVKISVELGRTNLPLSDMLKLGEGAVVELDRAVGDPVDLVADGVILARGEIVVVNDCYGIRITEV